MPPLTWQQIAAPDLSGAAQAYKIAGDQFNGAVDAVGTGIKAFDQDKTNDVSRQIALALAQSPSAAATQTAVQHGQFGGLDLTNPDVVRHLSPDAIKSFSPAALVEQAAQKTKLDAENLAQTQHIRTFDQQKALDEDPLVTQLAQAHATGADPAVIKDLESKIDWAPKGYENAQAFYAKGLGTDATYQSNRMGAFGNNNTIADAATDKRAQNVAEDLRPRATTPEGLNVLYQDAIKGHEKDPDFGRFSSKLANLLGMAATGPTGAITGTAPLAGSGSAAASALGATFGGGQLPNSVQTVGDAIKAGPSMVNSLGASPMGVYQINYGTLKEFGAKALGPDWESKPIRDFDVQDAVGKAIFESTKGDPKALQGRWASLSADQAAQISKLPWEQARQVIAKGESGADIGVVQAMAVAAKTGSQVERSAQDPTGLSARLVAAASSQRDQRVVAEELTKAHQGLTEQDAMKTLQAIRDHAHGMKVDLTPDQAKQIFEEASHGDTFGDKVKALIGFGGGSRAGTDVRIGFKDVDEAIRKYASPEVQQQVVADAERTRREALNSAGFQAFDSARNAYLTILNQSQHNSKIDPKLVQNARDDMMRAGAIAGYNTGELEHFTDPKYYGDSSLTIRPRATTPAAAIAAAARPVVKPVAPVLRSGLSPKAIALINRAANGYVPGSE